MIEQAKGIIIAEQGCSADQAFWGGMEASPLAPGWLLSCPVRLWRITPASQGHRHFTDYATGMPPSHREAIRLICEDRTFKLGRGPAGRVFSPELPHECVAHLQLSQLIDELRGRGAGFPGWSAQTGIWPPGG